MRKAWHLTWLHGFCIVHSCAAVPTPLPHPQSQRLAVFIQPRTLPAFLPFTDVHFNRQWESHGGSALRLLLLLLVSLPAFWQVGLCLD